MVPDHHGNSYHRSDVGGPISSLGVVCDERYVPKCWPAATTLWYVYLKDRFPIVGVLIIYFSPQMVKYCPIYEFCATGNKLARHILNKHAVIAETEECQCEKNLRLHHRRVKTILLGRPNVCDQGEYLSILERTVFQEHRTQVRSLKFI